MYKHTRSRHLVICNFSEAVEALSEFFLKNKELAALTPHHVRGELITF